MPDPAAYSLTAGGGRDPVNVASLGLYDQATGMPCGQAFITRSPDFRFFFTPGSSFNFLRMYVQTHNGADATLLVNQPDTSWRCNDDSFGTLMPSIDFSYPMSGQYDVWVGTYDASSHNPATFYITELDYNRPGGGQQGYVAPTPTPTPTPNPYGGQVAQGGSINVMGTPTYGTFNINNGFTPDPLTYNAVAGGEIQASSVIPGCYAGNIASVPDIRINYSAGTWPLRFYVSAPGTDTTLAVNAPDGTWYCNDDTVGLQPVIDFASPMSGQYDIFIGTFGTGQYPNVQLYVTELPASNGPTP
jgi:hypothetical protein